MLFLGCSIHLDFRAKGYYFSYTHLHEGADCVLAAIDGHAKNFLIFLTPGRYRLTPLHDVMSVAPYPVFLVQKVKLAMAFGNMGCYHLGQIQLRRFYQIGQKAGLHKQDMESIFTDLTERMEDAIVDATALAADVGMPESTGGLILAGVS